MNSSHLERFGALCTISQLGLKQLSRTFSTALTKESVSPGKQGASPRAFTESSLILAHNCGPCFAPGKSSAALKLVSWVITIFFFSTNTRAPSSSSAFTQKPVNPWRVQRTPQFRSLSRCVPQATSSGCRAGPLFCSGVLNCSQESSEQP